MKRGVRVGANIVHVLVVVDSTISLAYSLYQAPSFIEQTLYPTSLRYLDFRPGTAPSDRF